MSISLESTRTSPFLSPLYLLNVWVPGSLVAVAGSARQLVTWFRLSLQPALFADSFEVVRLRTHELTGHLRSWVVEVGLLVAWAVAYCIDSSFS